MGATCIIQSCIRKTRSRSETSPTTTPSSIARRSQARRRPRSRQDAPARAARQARCAPFRRRCRRTSSSRPATSCALRPKSVSQPPLQRRSTTTSPRRQARCGIAPPASSAGCECARRSSSIRTTAISASRSAPAERAATSTTRSSACSSFPAGSRAERKQRVALLFDEFQEIVALDPRLPNLMRSVFQTQPEVGPRLPGQQAARLARDLQRPQRALLAQHASDGARQAPAPGVRAASPFTVCRDGARRRRRSRRTHPARSRTATPYATQELAFFTWALVPHGHPTRVEDVEAGLANVLSAEHNNLARLWDAATRNERLVLLALARGRSTSMRRRHASGRACRRRPLSSAR